MKPAVLLSALVASALALGAVPAADAAQLTVKINPNQPTSEFEIRYQNTVFIEYRDGGQVADMLRQSEWSITASAPPGSADSAAIAEQFNQNIVADDSQAQVSNLDVEYSASLRGNPLTATIDYTVLVSGDLGNYVIQEGGGGYPSLIDMGWRGLSIQDPVYIGDTEINHLLSAIRAEEPELASMIAGSEAEDILSVNLIDGDFLRDQPLDNWHFLFDPTGISVDASQFGLDEEISGFVVSNYTMGESSIREGIQKERTFEATFTADRTYTVRTVQSADIGNVGVIGFAQRDRVSGIEIFGVMPTPPEGFGQTSTGDFPVAIIYGMAGVAAVGGVAFFAYSSRQIKKEEGQGQTGIDPSRLVGYQTSASSGGYQTNRGEAQLADASDYQQTRSVYDDSGGRAAGQPAPPPPQPQLAAAAQEAACGCAASVDMGNECDCEMQSSCLCDAGCGCAASVCRQYAQSF